MRRIAEPSDLRRNRRLTLVLFLVIFAGLLLGSSTSAISANPTAVTLLYFRGTGQDNAVFLEWATGTEFNTAGFRITRSTEQNGQYSTLDQIGFIAAKGDGLVGAEYEALDDANVSNGSVYWYKLIEFELDGRENPAGPISVTAGAAPSTATSTPIPTATPTTSGGNPDTATPETPDNSPTLTPTTTNSGSSIASVPLPTTNSSSSSLVPTASTLAQTDSSSSNTDISNTSNPENAVQPEATLNLSAYPEPGQVDNPDPTRTARSNGNQAYPEPDPDADAVSPTKEPAPYPQGVGERAPNLTPPPGSQSSPDSAVIGSLDSDRQDSDAAEEASEKSGTSTAILWMGFIASLLLFSAGVIGSIIYFSRQRMQGR